MKKHVSLILALAIIVLVCLIAAVGCSDKNDEVPTSPPKETITNEPADEPTEAPTDEPTEAPTGEPTEAPTDEPTEAPTGEPTETPTDEPTEAPTDEPTETPSETPSEQTECELNGHTWDDATCTTPKTCSVCGAVEGEALGHDKESHEALAPTCTEAGHKAYVTCKREGCTYTTYEEIEALGHDEESHEAQAPTCTEAGHEAYVTCKREGCTYTTYEEIEALGHKDDDNDHNCDTCGAVLSECADEDRNHKCDTCGAQMGEHVPAAEDTHTCSYCSQPASEHTGGSATCTEKAVCTICGEGYGDVLGHDPDTSAWMTDYAGGHYHTCKREGCEGKADLAAHTYVEGVCSICDVKNTFCTEGLEILFSSSNNAYYLDRYSGDASHIYIPYFYNDGAHGEHPVTFITSSLFYQNTAIESVSIPDSVYLICEYAFSGCTNLVTIDIPSSVYMIGFQAFYDTAWLENQPDGLVYAGNVAYKFKGNLGEDKSITIADGTSGIAEFCFSSLEELKSAYIPSSVKYIGNSAFANCTSIESIVYGGTLEQLKEATGNVFYNRCGKNLVISCEGDQSSFSTYHPAQAATCTEDGNVEYWIDFKTGKTYDSAAMFYEISDVTIPAACTDANDDHKCDACGSTISECIDTDKNHACDICGASVGDHAPAGDNTHICEYCSKPASDHSGGTAKCEALAVCSVCGEEYGEVLGHSFGDPNYTMSDDVKSCTASRKCQREGCSKTESESAEAVYESCTMKTVFTNTVFGSYTCDLTDLTSLSSDQAGAAVGLMLENGVTDIVITIPEASKAANTLSAVSTKIKAQDAGTIDLTINGDSEITTRAFEKCNSLKSVTFGAGIASVGNYAFSSCANLTQISFADGSALTEIRDYAFNECALLENFELPSGISTLGPYAFCKCSSITAVVIPEGVNTISYRVFSECSNLESVELPSTLRSIGDNTFKDCVKLGNVTLPDNLTTMGSGVFSGCTSITSIVIPNSVTSTLTNAFLNCTSLQSITFPETMSSIGSYVCSGCTALESVRWPEGITSVGTNAFYNCKLITEIYLPETVKTIWNEAFYNCKGLTSVALPSQLKTIGAGAFRYCSNITSFTGSNSIETLGNEAFKYCTKVTELPFLDNVSSIGYHVFYGCSKLESVQLGAIESIPTYAFRECKALKSVTYKGDNLSCIEMGAFYECEVLETFIVPESVTEIYSNAFYRCRLYDVGTLPSGLTALSAKAFYSTAIKSVVLPSGITEIKEGVFGYCSSLESVTLHENVTSIGNDAFKGCVKLKSIELPEGLGSIGEYSFDSCSALESIVIPEGVVSIGKFAFNYASKLATVSFPSTLESIGEDAFARCVLVNFKLPEGLKTIGPYAFLNGIKGKEVVIPDSVTSIGKGALSSIDANRIVIGSGITALPEDMLYRCENLDTLIFRGPITSMTNSSIASFYTDSKRIVVFFAPGQKVLNANAAGTLYTAGSTDLTDDGVTFAGCTFLKMSLTPLIDASEMTNEQITSTLSQAISNGATTMFIKLPSGSNAETFEALKSGISGADDGTISLVIDGITEIPEQAFFDFHKINAIVLSDGVVSIGNSAFHGSKGITDITIPASVTSIGANAFFDCENLAKIDVKNDSETYANYLGCILYTKDYKTLLAFPAADTRESLSIHDDTETIAENAFYGAKFLQTVSLQYESNLKRIENRAFRNCTALKKFWLGSSIEFLGDGVVQGCTNLTDVQFPESISKIPDEMFSGCTKLATNYYYSLPSHITEIGSSSFKGCTMKGVTMYTGLTTIGSYAFENCANLTDVRFPSTITTISSGAFSGCTSLESMVIPDTVTVLGADIFNGCSSLTSVTIGSGVSRLEPNIFTGCGSLTSVTFKAVITRISAHDSAAFGEVDTRNIDLTLANGQMNFMYTSIAGDPIGRWEETEQAVTAETGFLGMNFGSISISA